MKNQAIKKTGGFTQAIIIGQVDPAQKRCGAGSDVSRQQAGKLSGSRLTYKGCSGFTLIELLVVVLIIGILAAVALPQYQKAVVKSKFATLQVGVNALVESIQRYYLEYGELPPNGNLSNVDVAGLSGCETDTSGDLVCANSYYHWENTPWFGRYVAGVSIKGDDKNKSVIQYRWRLSETAVPEERLCLSDSTNGSVCKSMNGVPHPGNPSIYKLP